MLPKEMGYQPLRIVFVEAGAPLVKIFKYTLQFSFTGLFKSDAFGMSFCQQAFDHSALT